MNATFLITGRFTQQHADCAEEITKHGIRLRFGDESPGQDYEMLERGADPAAARVAASRTQARIFSPELGDEREECFVLHRLRNARKKRLSFSTSCFLTKLHEPQLYSMRDSVSKVYCHSAFPKHRSMIRAYSAITDTTPNTIRCSIFVYLTNLFSSKAFTFWPFPVFRDLSQSTHGWPHRSHRQPCASPPESSSFSVVIGT